MKIIADENIPFAEELFSSLGHVTLKPGRKMTANDVCKSDVLLVRSVTPVNQVLLDNSSVKFVGTCTIGTDHLDTDYLSKQDIVFSSAPGCNANAVVQYVFSALAYLGELNTGNKVGIIGCGNVGGRVYRQLKRLGFECVCVDPHLTSLDIPDLMPLEAIYECDVVCMHTPRVKDGPYPTESLLNAAHFPNLKPNAVLLNAGRGECINNADLKAYLRENNNLRVVLDVWSSEPNIDAELFSYLAIGTPHIAGYSFEGRVNGSTMIFRSLSAYLGKKPEWVDEHIRALEKKYFGDRQAMRSHTLSEAVLGAYDIQADHSDLQKALVGLPESFDMLRKNYPKRREISHFSNEIILRDVSEYKEDPMVVLGCE